EKSAPHGPEARLHGDGVSQTQRAVGHVYEVTTHVPQRAGAEVAPSTPRGRKVHGVEIAVRRGAQPQIPREFRWDRIGRGRCGDALRPNGPVGPDVHARDVTDHAFLNPGFDETCAVATATLVAH